MTRWRADGTRIVAVVTATVVFSATAMAATGGMLAPVAPGARAATSAAPGIGAPATPRPAPPAGKQRPTHSTPAPTRPPAPRAQTVLAPTGVWQPLGPAPIGPNKLAFGLFYGGKNSGRITALGQIPSGTHAGRIVAGSAGGGVWTSDDSGTTWTPRTDTQADLAIGALVVDPNSPDHIVVGTGEGNQSGDSFGGDGILDSTDGGATWSRQDPGGIFDGLHIAQVAVDPTNSLREFAATDAGLLETTNGGSSWAFPTDPSYANLAGFVSAVVVDSTGVVRVASTFGTWIVAQSADHGVTFTETDTGITHAVSSDLVALAVAPGTPSTIYVAVGQANSAMKVWKNTTGGSGTWTATSNPDYSGQAYSYGSGTANQGWYDNALAVDPTNANHVVAGGIALVETIDGGTTWTNVNSHTFFGGGTNKLHPDQHAVFFRSDHKILVGDDGGVYLYDPSGPTVTNLQGNLNITQFYGGFNAVGGQVLAGSQDNSSALYTGSAAWTGIYVGDGGPSAITANHPATMFIESNQSALVTTNAFASGLSNITPPTLGGQNFTPPMIVVPSTTTPADPTVYYGSGDGLWRTMNPTTGHSWTDLTGGLGSPVSAIAVAPSNNNYIYVGLDNGSVYASTNGGSVFNPLPSQPFAGVANFVTGLSVNPATPTEVTASFSGFGDNTTRSRADFPHIAQYNGTSWSNITGTGLPNQAVSRVVYDAAALVAATDSGVWASTDGGVTWSAVGTGLPNTQVQDLDVESDGLYAVTHGRGAWKLPQLPVITGVSPLVGPTAGGNTVSISGTGFATGAGATTVKFGSATATGVSCSSPTVCTATAPAGAGTVDVTATTGVTTSPITATDQYRYCSALCAAAPAVTWNGNVPDNALTNGGANPNVFWQPTSAAASPVTYEVYLGSSTTLSAVTSTWYAGFAPPSAYHIDTSADGVSWTTQYTTTSNAAQSPTDVFPGGRVTASYLRLVVTALPTPCGGCGYAALALVQFGWDGHGVSVPQAFGGCTTISPNCSPNTTVWNGNVANNAITNGGANPNVFWQPTAAASAPVTYEVDLGSATTLSAVTSSWYAGFAPPSAYHIDTSADGVSWTTQFTTASNASQSLTDVFPAGQATNVSYLRLVVTAFPSAGTNPYATLALVQFGWSGHGVSFPQAYYPSSLPNSAAANTTSTWRNRVPDNVFSGGPGGVSWWQPVGATGDTGNIVLGVDLGTARTVSNVTAHWLGSSACPLGSGTCNGFNPINYQIWVSSSGLSGTGTNWTQVATVSGFDPTGCGAGPCTKSDSFTAQVGVVYVAYVITSWNSPDVRYGPAANSFTVS